jgi:hypothetical protein
MVKSSSAADVVPIFVTSADVPGAPVNVQFTLMVAVTLPTVPPVHDTHLLPADTG